MLMHGGTKAFSFSGFEISDLRTFCECTILV